MLCNQPSRNDMPPIVLLDKDNAAPAGASKVFLHVCFLPASPEGEYFTVQTLRHSIRLFSNDCVVSLERCLTEVAIRVRHVAGL
jgi:hypothetical protein